MLKNCNGFTLVETLSAFFLIILCVFFLVLPLHQITLERNNIERKGLALAFLHDLMQEHLYDSYTTELSESSHPQFQIRTDVFHNGMVKSCARWKYKRGADEVCVYGKK